MKVIIQNKQKQYKDSLQLFRFVKRKFQQRIEEKLKELEELREAVETHKVSLEQKNCFTLS